MVRTMKHRRLQQERLNANIVFDDSSRTNGGEPLMGVNVVSHLSQCHASWLGGSIVASDSRFPTWIRTKQSYEEEGSRIFRSSDGMFY